MWVKEGLISGPEGWDAWLLDGEEYLRKNAKACNRVVGVGRALAKQVQIDGLMGVWRTNRHGGILGSLQGDRYFSSYRLACEIRLSQELRNHGIATPEVLLGLAVRHGFFWRQHLVTAEVLESSTVFSSRENSEVLVAASHLLNRLASLGLYASDIHPGNMLWQESTNTCWIIDLAGARLLGRPLRSNERESMRRRFVRYFRKYAGEIPYCFQSE